MSRIGIDVSQTVYEGTGVGNYYRQLWERLPQLDKENEYIFFGSSLRRRKKGFWPFPPTFLDLLWNQWHVLPVENLTGKLDIFHSSDWTQPPTKAKKVTTIFDLVVYKYPESSHSKIVATQKRRLEWVKKEVDKIITISQSSKKDIVEIFGIPEEKITVTYLAPSLGPIIPGIRKKYSLNKPFILALGTREPRKNLARLIEAFKKLDRKDYDLVVVGKYGWGGGELRVNKEEVRMLEYIPEGDKLALLAEARALVYPSLYEGFGLPVVEAMSVGTPVITSNISGMPEAGGDAAIYVKPEEINDISEKLEMVITMPATKYSNLKYKCL